MKRRILSIAFIAISAVMFTSVAKNNDRECSQACQKEHKMKQDGRKQKPAFNPFEGITLSDSQKEQLKTKAQERKKDREKFAQAQKDAKLKQFKSHQDMRKQQLDDLKKILTHEQYVKYLENIALNQPHKPKMKGHGSQHKPMRMH